MHGVCAKHARRMSRVNAISGTAGEYTKATPGTCQCLLQLLCDHPMPTPLLCLLPVPHVSASALPIEGEPCALAPLHQRQVQPVQPLKARAAAQPERTCGGLQHAHARPPSLRPVLTLRPLPARTPQRQPIAAAPHRRHPALVPGPLALLLRLVSRRPLALRASVPCPRLARRPGPPRRPSPWPSSPPAAADRCTPHRPLVFPEEVTPPACPARPAPAAVLLRFLLVAAGPNQAARVSPRPAVPRPDLCKSHKAP